MQLKASCTREHPNRHTHAGRVGVDTHEVSYVAHDDSHAAHAGSAGKHRAGAVAGVGADREDSSELTAAQFWREPTPRETPARNIAAAAPPPPLLLRVRPGGRRVVRARRAHADGGTRAYATSYAAYDTSYAAYATSCTAYAACGGRHAARARRDGCMKP